MVIKLLRVIAVAALALAVLPLSRAGAGGPFALELRTESNSLVFCINDDGSWELHVTPMPSVAYTISSLAPNRETLTLSGAGPTENMKGRARDTDFNVGQAGNPAADGSLMTFRSRGTAKKATLRIVHRDGNGQSHRYAITALPAPVHTQCGDF